MIFNTFFFDLDGTVYKNSIPIGDIIFEINCLIENKKNVFFLTNNTSVTKDVYIEKLVNLQLHCINRDMIVTPIDVFLWKKAEQIGDYEYFMNKSVKNYLIEKATTTHSKNKILVGFNTEYTYGELVEVIKKVNNGYEYAVTHDDLFCPTLDGGIPDCGSIRQTIENCTFKKPVDNFGKPSENMIDYLKERCSADLTGAVIFGDRLTTDIFMGKKMGIKTVWVKSGDVTPNKRIIPSFTFETAADCLKNWRK
jgi:HAD superfamily hydrolase (TIGR01450 family)